MKNCQYTIFKTKWGWFGLLASEKNKLMHTYLPVLCKDTVKTAILSHEPHAQCANRNFSVLQQKIKNYYNGLIVDFNPVQLYLAELSSFTIKVLTALQGVDYGTTITYSELARLSGHAKAARAIGSVMAKNPLPLIIPCHRVIKADGSIGQFSGPGSTHTKKQMIDLEQSKCVTLYKGRY